MDRIIELAEKYADEMIENRRKIHKNPELGGQVFPFSELNTFIEHE